MRNLSRKLEELGIILFFLSFVGLLACFPVSSGGHHEGVGLVAYSSSSEGESEGEGERGGEEGVREGGGGGEADRGRNRDRDLGRGGLVRRAPPTEDAAPLKKRQRPNSESQQTPQQ